MGSSSVVCRWLISRRGDAVSLEQSGKVRQRTRPLSPVFVVVVDLLAFRPFAHLDGGENDSTGYWLQESYVRTRKGRQ
jgi:hypothetical protein